MLLGFSNLFYPLRNMDKCPHLSNLAQGMETYLTPPLYKECNIKYNQLNLHAKNELIWKAYTWSVVVARTKGGRRFCQQVQSSSTSCGIYWKH